MRIVLGFIAALLVYVGCYCLMLKGGRYVTLDNPVTISRAKPVYRLFGPGEQYEQCGSAVEAIFAPVNEIDRLVRPGAWRGPQPVQRRVR